MDAWVGSGRERGSFSGLQGHYCWSGSSWRVCRAGWTEPMGAVPCGPFRVGGCKGAEWKGRAERAEFDESDPGIDVGLGPIGGGTSVEDAEFGGEFLIFFGGELRAGFAGGGGGRRGGGGIGLGVDGQEERRGREDEEGEKGKFHGNDAAMVAGDGAVWRTEFRRVGRE